MDVTKKAAQAGGELLEKGRAALGNPEAKFNQSVKEKMKRESKSEDEAQRECLADLANMLQIESASGIVEKKSQGFREFLGALNTILSKKEIQQYKKDSETPLFSAPSGISVDADNITNQQQYFEAKFKNYGGQSIPDRSTVYRHALQTKNMEAILARIASGLSSGSLDLADLKTGGTADSADIGKVLCLKENMDRAESAHEFRLGSAKVLRAMWESAKTDIAVHMWGDIKNMFVSGFRLDPKGLLFNAVKLAAWDIPLFFPKLIVKGVLNMFTPRPDRIYT